MSTFSFKKLLKWNEIKWIAVCILYGMKIENNFQNYRKNRRRKEKKNVFVGPLLMCMDGTISDGSYITKSK